jgi:hypothetical protein
LEWGTKWYQNWQRKHLNIGCARMKSEERKNTIKTKIIEQPDKVLGLTILCPNI